jgi:hypothetical protein
VSERRRLFRRAYERQRRVEAGDDDAPMRRASAYDAPEVNERRRRTLGPMVMAVARGTVGFDSSGGGHEEAQRRRILEERMRQQILDARA